MDRSDPTPLAFRGDSFASPRPNRRTLVKGVAWSAPVLAVATTAPALAASSPTGQCYPAGTLFDAQARGRLLSGAIGGINLDAVAEAAGVHAEAFEGTPNAASHTVMNPLNVTALSALELQLTGLGDTLSDLLSGLTDVNVGAVNQYATAHAAAEVESDAEVGGAGTVSDNGVLDLANADGGSAPALGTLSLYNILNQLTGTGVADVVNNITQLDLEIGALGGLATMNSLCVDPHISDTDSETALSRSYVLASLGLDVASPLVGGVLTAIPQSLAVDTDDLWALINSIPGLGPLLSGIGRNLLTATVTIDRAQLTDPIPNTENPALQIALEDGQITIDVASLLGGAYTGNVSPWLNELGSNTRLFVDAGVPGDALTSFINDLSTTLLDRIKNLLHIEVRGGTPVTNTRILHISGSLADFLNGDADVDLIGINLGSLLLNPLLEGIGDLVDNLVAGLFAEGGAVATALQAVNALLSSLFDVLEGVLAITVNAQNTASGSMPSYYQSVTTEGRYDVAALHVEALGVVNLLNLSLGRGSVGENTARVTGPANRGIQLPF